MNFPTFQAFTWRRLVFAAVVFFALSAAYNALPAVHQYERNRAHVNAPVTVEQKSAHMVILLDEDEKPHALCSSTAVGPHTIMTASHCNLGKDEEHSTELDLDYSVRHYHILAELEDGQDHVVYLLDGPEFKNYINSADMFATDATAPIQSGDEIVFYGDGEGQYPPQPKYGIVDGDAVAQDISDVDRGAGIEYYTVDALHGDSGSAIYDKNGHIVGLLTYGLGREKAASFALNFPADFEAKLEAKAAIPPVEKKKADEKFSFLKD